jgi:hypothetical protein
MNLSAVFVVCSILAASGQADQVSRFLLKVGEAKPNGDSLSDIKMALTHQAMRGNHLRRNQRTRHLVEGLPDDKGTADKELLDDKGTPDKEVLDGKATTDKEVLNDKTKVPPKKGILATKGTADKEVADDKGTPDKEVLDDNAKRRVLRVGAESPLDDKGTADKELLDDKGTPDKEVLDNSMNGN